MYIYAYSFKWCVLNFISSISWTGYCLHTMDSSNLQCRVRQCFYCEESTVFVCSKCDQNICGPCRRKHLHKLSTTQYQTVAYRVKFGKKKLIADRSFISYCNTCKLPLCAYCQRKHEVNSHPIFNKRRLFEIESYHIYHKTRKSF